MVKRRVLWQAFCILEVALHVGRFQRFFKVCPSAIAIDGTRVEAFGFVGQVLGGENGVVFGTSVVNVSWW